MFQWRALRGQRTTGEKVEEYENESPTLSTSLPWPLQTDSARTQKFHHLLCVLEGHCEITSVASSSFSSSSRHLCVSHKPGLMQGAEGRGQAPSLEDIHSSRGERPQTCNPTARLDELRTLQTKCFLETVLDRVVREGLKGGDL